MLFAVGCGQPAATTSTAPGGATPSTPEKEPVVRVDGPPIVFGDADEPLWQQYLADPAAADKKYRGRAVEFDATVILDAHLGGGYELLARRPDYTSVYRIFPRADQKSRADKIGDRRVKVRGWVRGSEPDGGGYKNRVVVIEDGVILGYYSPGADGAQTYTPAE
jgi:hypothetical protein